MGKNNFLLLSMDDEKLNKVANVVSNKTCKKILDALSEKDLTESEISKKLDIPISTVHYNIQQLMDAGLVAADEYHYSRKGREMLHYRLANKYIIIAPNKKRGLRSILRGILPVALVIGFFGAAIELFQRFSYMSISAVSENMAMDDKSIVTEAAARSAEKAMDSAVPSSALLSNHTGSLAGAVQMKEVIAAVHQPGISFWFLLGGSVAIITYTVIALLKKE